MPPSYVGAYADPQSKHLKVTDPNVMLGHHGWMKGIIFDGAVIHWGAQEDAFDGTTLNDQLNMASLRYLKGVIAEAEAELRAEQSI